MMNIKVALGYALLACCLSASTNAYAKGASKGRVMEMRADRVVIYPQRMDLKGDESLGDVLAMYPDLMQSGFDEMLSGYNLRIDNVAVNGNQRIVCRQLKASMISAIQICDNTAVAKGTTGLNRVIDITLLRGNHASQNVSEEDALQGLTGVEVGSDHLADHHAVVRYDGAKTDVVGIHSYQCQDRDDVISQRQNLFAHMTNYFSPKDRLLTYVSQQYLNNRYYHTDAGKDKTQNEKLLARVRYFHKFNDKGTELLLVGSYQYTDAPHLLYQFRRPTTYDNKENQSDVVAQAKAATKNNSSLFIVELNTPLTSNLSMMAGWEGDFSYSRYHAEIEYNRYFGGDNGAETRYVASNNDLYLQFNYIVGPMRFTIGDRVMFYHYGTNAVTDDPAHDAGFRRANGRESYNETRNNVELSAVASISEHHQIQAAYHRKFFNPGYSVTESLSYNEWKAICDGLEAQYIDETKLGYTYSRSNFTFSLAAYYQMMEHAANRTKVSASTFYRSGIFAFTSGVDFIGMKLDDNDDYNYAAAIHFSPRLTLPWQMQFNVQSIFALGQRDLAMDENVYLSGQLCKQLGKHWNFAVEWHDICSSHYSACLGTVQYVF